MLILHLSLTNIQAFSLSELESLVVDEADLVFSYGHDEDIKAIISGGYLPKVYQSFLMSATMTKDVEKLKGLVLRNPVSKFIALLVKKFLIAGIAQAILRLEEDEEEATRLSQYAVRSVVTCPSFQSHSLRAL